MEPIKFKEISGPDGSAESYFYKDRKTIYKLSYQSTYARYDIWDILVENYSNKIGESFTFKTSYKVKHNKDNKKYDIDVLNLGIRQIDKITKTVRKNKKR